MLRLTPKNLEEAERHLCKSDRVLGALVLRHGRCELLKGERRPFEGLVRSVIGQMLSLSAARSIDARVAQIVPKPYRPECVLDAPVKSLRAAGLSQRKVDCIRELSSAVLAGKIDFRSLHRYSDEEVIRALSSIKGIGTWTAQMHLIFGMHRPDVWSEGDAGLARAIRKLYGKRAMRGEGAPIKIAEQWRPYRSVASWYLWRHLD